MGYVGLHLAVLAAKKGYEVLGIDTDTKKVKKINAGVNPIKDKSIDDDFLKVYKHIKAKDTYEGIETCDVIVIAVPTPVTADKTPDLSYLLASVKELSAHLRKGQLVIVESTVGPGTLEEVVKPLLERFGLKESKDFFLAHCPERIDPGNKRYKLENIPRVLGALSREGLEKAMNFYKSILNAEVLPLSSAKAAELTKIVENTFRDINIAFVNELAKSCEVFGIDVLEVIKGASTKPFAFMAHYPGCGVGGHCIPVDPYYLIERAESKGVELKLIKTAQEVNDSMPYYTVSLLESEVGNLLNKKVGVMGLAFKANIGDTRLSPALKIVDILKSKQAAVETYDPYVPELSTVASLDDLLEKSDYIILATDHDVFRNMDYRKLKNKVKIIIDGRNCLNKRKIEELGIIYKGIGH